MCKVIFITSLFLKTHITFRITFVSNIRTYPQPYKTHKCLNHGLYTPLEHITMDGERFELSRRIHDLSVF
ncbi:protein of unknown function [Oenococcus oeni]|uniref:Uncharacterized protein n=1 Tax=Oenococcus oeni TaxID=1247 RepID=A0AAQ2URD6_OENOE|nr:hypothetical protein OENI_260003 [Oenococcus oeni]VDB97502.1 protein of unknown function [Oenococcus oeni]